MQKWRDGLQARRTDAGAGCARTPLPRV